MEKIIFAYADSVDLKAIELLLMDSELPNRNVAKHLSHFIVAKNHDKLIGVIGLEVLNTIGLVRSLAVSPFYQGQGIAKKLCIRILVYAHLKGIKELHLSKLTAEGFFSKVGFNKIKRNKVPTGIQSTEEFLSLCPSSAVCMVKNIENELHYYPKEMLRLNPDVPVSAM